MSRQIAVRVTVALGLCSWLAVAAPVEGEARQAAEASIAKGVAFLVAKQMDSGAWLQHPAVTSLACAALHRSPDGGKPEMRARVDKGLDFVTTQAQPDGSVWNRQAEEYPNYSTAISLIALAVVNRPQDAKVIRGARDFLLASQFGDETKDGPWGGGVGYGKKLRPDLSNTQWALEALKVTDHLDREPFAKDPQAARRADLAWDRALVFLAKCQNLKGVNDQAWVASDPDNQGGFVYMPGESKAGETKSADGEEVALRSYGSMTYAGLKSMLYAKVGKDDKRVQAAVDWLRRHYTFDENPGMGLQGHYYYLHTCAKALSAFGEESFTDAAGKAHAWRQELVTKLVSLQKPGGEWTNENGRWWESIPELATSYSLLALEVALGRGLEGADLPAGPTAAPR